MLWLVFDQPTLRRVMDISDSVAEVIPRTKVAYASESEIVDRGV